MKRQNIFIFLFVNLLSFDSNAQTKNDFLESVFHPDSLKSIVEVLASDSFEGRFTGSTGCMKAASFIADEFKKAGLKPLAGLDGFFMPFTNSKKNIVGAIRGRTKPDEIVIFSAHYDHVGTESTNPYPNAGGKGKISMGDTIYNGANDNASGTSAIISLAKYFVQQSKNERTLLFVAFDGEELGLLGSTYFADHIEPEPIIAVINIEMIGRKDNGTGKPYITGSQYSDLFKILNRRLNEYDSKTYGKKFIERDMYVNENLFIRSDNYSFAQLGIPAHSIMVTSTTDKYYHSLSDEPTTLDYRLMSNIIKAIAISCRGLVDGTDTPSRIKSLK